MWIAGSGKTTLANKIFQKLDNSSLLNGDIIRKEFNDWDFSELGRERQAKRMKEKAMSLNKQWVILDFVCPKEKFRKMIDPEILIFMDTIENSRFEDTNIIFEKPKNKVEYSFTEFDSDNQSDLIVKQIQTLIEKGDCSNVR